ncbi:MAG: M23 family metallopeptidase [bacterium]|nr:M23 family metallopeptidase [bacterium]
MKKIVAVFIVAIILPLSAYAGTFEVLNHNSKVNQGGILIVKIADELKDKNLQLCVFDELYSFNKNGLVFIGINVEQKSDRYILYLMETRDQKQVQYDFYYTHVEILKKEFGPPWYAGAVPKPNKAIEGQRKKEATIKQKAYDSANTAEDYTEGQFILPFDSVTINDAFGTPRLYGHKNRKTKKIKIKRQVSHAGVDLKAQTPLPVKAINSGKVLLARNFPLRGTEGNMLIIDHGSGILSIYLHLSKFKVKVGNTVTKGQIVAITGKTPRGTPPHLHMMVKINGTNVDPLGFIETFNRYLNQ